MEPVLLSIDPAWAAGLFLALARVAGFAVASPLLSRTFPPIGRLAFTIAVGASLTVPVDATGSLATLLGAGLLNVAVGLALGWLTGVIFLLFNVTGATIDFGSGLAVSQVLDPMTGDQSAVFGRWLPLTAMALLLVTGGLPVVVAGLARSVRAIPLDGSAAFHPDLAVYAGQQVSALMFTGIELALPLIATLLVAEVLLGLASRLVPQFNVFLLGLPAKIWITLAVMSLLVLRFPAATGNVLEHIDGAFDDVIRGLSSTR